MRKIILAAFIFLLAAGCNTGIKQTEEQSAVKDQPEHTITPHGNYDTFNSEKLGISFEFYNKDVQIKVTDNKIELADPNTFTTPKSLEVFKVNSGETPEQTLSREILGSKYPNCKISEDPKNDFTIYPKIWDDEKVMNSLPDTEPSWTFHVQDCPDGYGATNAVRYFRYYPEAQKIVFFNLGQDAWPAARKNGDNYEGVFTDTLKVK